MEKQYYTYIISNKKYGTIYIGVTNDLARRIFEHKNKLADGFLKKWGLAKLVYYETHENVESAIVREKQLKNWKRLWKCDLIDGFNEEWNDLYLEL